MIPEADIGLLRDRIDLEALIGEYLSLKRVGSSLRGLCPFHNEKTPSFYVHPARQLFHCFGCGASGDAIAFFMRIEGVGFVEAVRALADRTGVQLASVDTREDAAARRERARKERLYALMEAATEFYARQLQAESRSHPAWQELERRAIQADTVEAFRLGYAPAGWDGLLRFLRGKELSMQEAEALGLIVPRRSGSGHYDRFRHRLMFPITDVRGRVVAFSGRRLEALDVTEAPREEPKYINSPENPLYHKGELLFGFHEARVALRRVGWALLCEGNFDLLALHQAGFANVVAPMGTAFTDTQAKLLKRAVNRATLLFDGDGAGRKAVASAYPLLQQAGIGARVASLPQGHDPDSFLRERGADALQQLIDKSPGIVEFLIDVAAREASDTRSKADAIQGLGPVLGAVDSPVERRLYIERVARRFGINDLNAVRAQLRRGLAAGGGRRSARPAGRAPGAESVPGRTDHVKLPLLQCELLGACLDQPTLFTSEAVENLDGLLTTPELQAIFRSARALVGEHGTLKAPDLLDKIPHGQARAWLEQRLSVQKYDDDSAVEVIRQGMPLLAKEHIERERARLAQLICEARQRGDDDQAIMLSKQRDELARSATSAAQDA